jgi:hypothetical protein
MTTALIALESSKLALACGGRDEPSNMQRLTVVEGKAKDRTACDGHPSRADTVMRNWRLTFRIDHDELRTRRIPGRSFEARSLSRSV